MVKTGKIRFPWFLIVFIIGAGYKIFSIRLPLFEDLGLWGFSQIVYDRFLLNFYSIPHPPLGPFIYRIFGKIFGSSPEILRFAPVFITLVMIVILYRFACEFLNKKVALAATILLLFTYFPHQASITPDLDNAFLPFFITLIIYLLYSYQKNKDLKFIYLAGIFQGMLLLLKLQTFMIMLPIVLSIYYIEKNIKKTFKLSVIVLLISLALFSIFPLFIYIFENKFFAVIMNIIFHQNTAQIFRVDNKITFLSFLPLAIVLTPLYVYFPLVSFLEKKKEDDILYIWLILILTIYIITIPAASASDFPRYYSILIPFFALITARVFENFSIKPLNLFLFIIAALAGVFLIIYINEKNVFPNWYIVSATCPIQRISKKVLYYFLGSGNMLGILWLILRKKWFGKTIVYLFLLVTLSLNIFMMVNLFLNKEYFYTLNKLIDYSKKNSYKKPVYAWDEEIAYYLGCKGVNPSQSASKEMALYANYLGINQENSYTDISGGEIEFYKKQFNSVGGTVFLLNYPSEYGMNTVEKKETFKLIKENCRAILEITWDGRNAGGIYECK